MANEHPSPLRIPDLDAVLFGPCVVWIDGERHVLSEGESLTLPEIGCGKITFEGQDHE